MLLRTDLGSKVWPVATATIPCSLEGSIGSSERKLTWEICRPIYLSISAVKVGGARISPPIARNKMAFFRWRRGFQGISENRKNRRRGRQKIKETIIHLGIVIIHGPPK